MTRTIISPLTLSLLCPLLALACDPEDIADSDAELPDESEGEITPRSNQIPVACQSLTPAAIQAPVTKIDESIVQINEYLATTPTSVYDPNAGYNVLGTIALGHLDQAKAKITGYQTWLTSINHGNPFVYWEGAVPFFEMTDAAHSLHHATWWAYLGMGYDKKEVARQSAKRAGEAQQLASDLGRQGLLCAMEQYFNCGDGNVDSGESCDDGNLIDDDGCSHTCQPDGGTCGNGVVNPGEACDDGNSLDNDGCAQCQALTPWPLQPENPCAALTPAAIQHSLDLTDEAIDFIDEYLTETPVSNYANAGQYALDYYEEARAKITGHQAYLAGIPHGDPYVSWEGVAQGTWEAMMGAAWSLRYGAWWGHIATAYDHKPESRMSVRRAFAAQELADHLARQALLCTMYPYALCSDGVLNGTEECDDGNLVAGDGCSSTCTTESVCGDGVVAGDEECDDGNSIGDDGCESCEVNESTGMLYVRLGGSFKRFSEATNSWTPLANAPSHSVSSLTNDGQYVYLMTYPEAQVGIDPATSNRLYRYDPAQNVWENWAAGPPMPNAARCGTTEDPLRWVGDGFYFVNNWCHGGSNVGIEVWSYKDNEWELVEARPGVVTTGMGAWDRASDRLHLTLQYYYGGVNTANGIVTIDTEGDAGPAALFLDVAGTPNAFTYGAFSRGTLYRWIQSNIQMRRYSPAGNTWTWSGSGEPNVEGFASATDHGDGDVYIMSPGTIRRYDPDTHIVSAPLPNGAVESWDAKMTVLRPLAE